MEAEFIPITLITEPNSIGRTIILAAPAGLRNIGKEEKSEKTHNASVVFPRPVRTAAIREGRLVVDVCRRRYITRGPSGDGGQATNFERREPCQGLTHASQEKAPRPTRQGQGRYK